MIPEGNDIMLEKLNEKSISRLADAILCLETREECYSFLEDLCTVAEIKAMAQRIEVAQLLEKHALYSDIVQETGASTATISRVKRALNYGSDGYKKVLEKLGRNPSAQ